MKPRKVYLLSLVAAMVVVLSPSHAAPDFSRIKSVAIIAGLGDELTISSMGGTRFSRGETKIGIEDWSIDDLVSGRAAELLQRRFTVETFAYERSKLFSFLGSSPDSKALSDVIGSFPNRPNVDAYVVLVKLSRNNWPWIAQNVNGLALSRSATLGAPERFRAHALYAIYIFDARSLQQLDWQAAKSSDKYPLPWPVTEADKTLWPADGHTLTSGQGEQAKTLMIDLLGDSLEESFRRMGLLE